MVDKNSFVPVLDRILILSDAAKTKTDGGIILEGNTEIIRNTGRILALGPGVKADVKVGDRVMFHCFDELPSIQDDVVVIRDKSLLFKFEE